MLLSAPESGAVTVAFLTNGDSIQAYRVTATPYSLTLLRTIPVNGTNSSIAATPDGSLVFAAHLGEFLGDPDDTVSVIDTVAGQVVVDISVGGRAAGAEIFPTRRRHMSCQALVV